MILGAQGGEAGQRLALEKFERRAAARRDEGHPLGEALLLQSGHQVAAADDRLRVTAGESPRQRVGPPIERRGLLDAERAVPHHGSRAVARLKEALPRPPADVEGFYVRWPG